MKAIEDHYLSYIDDGRSWMDLFSSNHHSGFRFLQSGQEVKTLPDQTTNDGPGSPYVFLLQRAHDPSLLGWYLLAPTARLQSRELRLLSRHCRLPPAQWY